MPFETALLWWNFNILTKKRYDALVSVFGNLDDALHHLTPGILKELGCRDETVSDVLVKVKTFDASAYRANMSDARIGLLTIEDDGYPTLLKEIPDAPVFLSYKGNLEALKHPLIAMVGTRGMSGYGKRIVEELVPTFVRSGCTTVSGLALGIDAEVAEQTLKHGGRHIAVLGHGLSDVYPVENEKLAEEIIGNGGILLSEFPIDVPPEKFRFPSRNRIIAGLAQATVVCEAPIKSGAIITAELALDYNKSVFAVPGPIFDVNFGGCNALIARGEARLLHHPHDLLLEMEIAPAQGKMKNSYSAQNEAEKTVYALLTQMPQKSDDLIALSGLDVATVSTTLTMMELAGAVRNTGGGEWVRA